MPDPRIAKQGAQSATIARVADAIANAFTLSNSHDREEFEDAARAAIQAMTEPETWQARDWVRIPLPGADMPVATITGVKLCKDCRHCTPELRDIGYAGTQAICVHPRHGSRVSLVTGAPQPTGPYCTGMRLDDGPCGIEGRLWEPKDLEKEVLSALFESRL